MSTELNLKDLEKKAFRSFYQDGIWDIYFGACMLVLYLTSFMGGIESKPIKYGLTLLMFTSASAFLIFGKKFITAPRLGRVKFGAERTKRSWILIGVNLISLIVLAGGITFLSRQDGGDVLIEKSHLWSSIGLGVWIAFITSVMAYFLDFDRLYIYAVFYGGTFTAVLLLDNPIVFLVTSLLILVPGFFIFSRFLAQTGVPDQGGE
jgi:hypothetical protein